jgi:hypothetical protein
MAKNSCTAFVRVIGMYRSFAAMKTQVAATRRGEVSELREWDLKNL